MSIVPGFYLFSIRRRKRSPANPYTKSYVLEIEFDERAAVSACRQK